MADNFLNNAQWLGALRSKPLIRRNVVNLGDLVDFFKFTIRRSSNASFRLSELQSNADMVLLNAKGKVLRRSRASGTQEESISRRLVAGTYYIQVRNRTSSGTRYKLTASTGTSAIDGTANYPIDLGTLTDTPLVISRGRADATPADVSISGVFKSATYYKVQSGQLSTLTGALSQVTGTGEMWILYDLNRNGKLDSPDEYITSAKASQSSNDPFVDYAALPGTLFLVALQPLSSSSFVYDFTLRHTPMPGNIPTDPGSEPTVAFPLGTLPPGGKLEVKEHVDYDYDEVDLYRFTLSTNSTVKLTDTGTGPLGVNARLLRDVNNDNILDNPVSLFEESANLQAGEYFLEVSAPSGNFKGSIYTVTVTAQ